MNSKKMNLKLIDIFSIFILISIIIFIVINIVLKGKLIVFDNFHDHLTHIFRITDKSKYPDAYMTFPPFAYFIYDILGISDFTIAGKNLYNTSIFTNEFSHSIYIYSLTMLVSFTVFALAIIYLFKQSNISVIFFALMSTFSYPILNAFHIGNSVLLTMIFIFLSLIFLDCNQNTLSLIFLSLAFGLKFYPAIFGLIFIKRRDYISLVKLAIFGIIVLIIPSFYFEGFGTLKKVFDLLRSFDGSRLFVSNNIYFVINRTFNILLNIDISNNFFVLNLIRLVLIILSIYGFFKSDKKWKEYFFLAHICNICFFNAYLYNCVYYVPAVIFYFYENKDVNFELKYSIHFVFPLLFFTLFMMNYTIGALHLLFIYIIFIYILIPVNKLSILLY